MGGVAVRIYSPAKTVADCFKFRNKVGLDVALEALREVWRSRKASVDELMEAAEVDRCPRSFARTWRLSYEWRRAHESWAFRFSASFEQGTESGDEFNLLLVRYGVERFMYRLSISPFKESFILKGASLFLVWRGQNYRVTRDVDLLGYGDPDPARLLGVFRAVCALGCHEDDGIDYDQDSLRVEEIREGQEYDGVRVTLNGLLHQARILFR
jgi:hypothetical protein